MDKTAKKNNLVLLFALLSLLYFTSYMTRLNLSASKAILIDDLKLFTKPQLGVLGTALFFTYGLGQLISGILSDRFRPDRIVSLGLITTVICNAILPFFKDTVAVMAVIWGINGLAQAFFWPPIVRLLSKYTNKKEYTKGVWLVSVASYAATLLIYVIVPLEINYVKWQAAFRFPAVLALVVLIIWNVCFAIFKKNAVEVPSDADEQDSKSSEASSERLPGDPEKKKNSVWAIITASGAILLFIAVAMQGFFKDGLQDWFPTLLTEGFGMDASYATFSNVVLPIFSIITLSLSTVLFEKVFKNEVKEAIVFFCLTAVLCGVMIPILKFKVSPILLLILAGVVNSCLHGINAMFTCFAPRRYRKADKVATMSGIFNACSYMGGALSSYGIGFISEKLDWTASLGVWCGACVIGIITCAVVLRKWTRYIQ